VKLPTSQVSGARWDISHGWQGRYLTPTHVSIPTRSISADRKRNLRKYYSIKKNKGSSSKEHLLQYAVIRRAGKVSRDPCNIIDTCLLVLIWQSPNTTHIDHTTATHHLRDCEYVFSRSRTFTVRLSVRPYVLGLRVHDRGDQDPMDGWVPYRMT
jgi:hypothetical protein